MFDVDSYELAQLASWLHKSPKKFAAASAMWLNRAAFHTMERARGEIHDNMTIRNGSFVGSRLRYQKVARSANFAEQVSYAGSIGDGRRFTGWAEQEGVGQTKRRWVITKAARGGSYSRSVVRRNRLRGGVQRPSPRDYSGVPRSRRAIVMLSDLNRRRERNPFIVSGHPTLPSGLYRLRGKRLLALQLFGRRPAATKPQHWLRDATSSYFRTISTRSVWGGIVRRITLRK